MRENSLIEIPRETTFDCPEGSFAATLHDMRTEEEGHGKQRVEYVRVVFEVSVPSMPYKQVLVGRNFQPQSRQLRHFFLAWLGDELQANLVNGRFDARAHFGRPAEIVITHYRNSNFNRPFVKVESIHPPGSLHLGESIATEEEKG